MYLRSSNCKLTIWRVNPESTYLEHLRTIESTAAFVARRNRLDPDETAEFIQIVRVRFLEDDYAILRKFEGRSSFDTYLKTVILRLFHQWKVEEWGKWRPSAEAKRLGDKAVTLERLITRDGFSFEEAVKVLTTPASTPYTVEELEQLYLRLPLRNPRPVVVSGDTLPETVAESDADDRIEARDRESTARAAAHVLDTVIQTMDPEDRLILQMRFWNARKVPEIAKILRMDQRSVYRRMDKLLAQLRASLELAGVGGSAIDALLSRGEVSVSSLSLEKDDSSGARNGTGKANL
jgi:RNA polymerase sigma factor (sigma-70 family)